VASNSAAFTRQSLNCGSAIFEVYFFLKLNCRAVCHFFAWLERHEIGRLADIELVHVAVYIEVLQETKFSEPKAEH
jgi:hypothetical protein